MLQEDVCFRFSFNYFDSKHSNIRLQNQKSFPFLNYHFHHVLRYKMHLNDIILTNKMNLLLRRNTLEFYWFHLPKSMIESF